MKRQVIGLTASALVSGGLGLLSLGPAAPLAQAAPCPALQSCTTWCPGQPLPAGRPIPWDGGVCHDFYWDSYGVHDIGTGQFYAWRGMPFK
jgi:hypothetical protein